MRGSGLYTIGGGYLPGRGKGPLGWGRSVSPEMVVRALVALMLDLIPHNEARVYLDDEARKRADKAADLAEDVKFPG